MEGKCLENTCSFAGGRPIMADLPYPPIRVRGENRRYADLLSVDYCGSVSELSAITQYINNENRLSCAKCPIAKSILGIAMAEMIHLQKLGQLIFLLGGDVSFVAVQQSGRQKMWTPSCLDIPDKLENMLRADIEAETAAINQYRAHMRMIKDECINAVLDRIIMDEEYHIMILQALLNEI